MPFRPVRMSRPATASSHSRSRFGSQPAERRLSSEGQREVQALRSAPNSIGSARSGSGRFRAAAGAHRSTSGWTTGSAMSGCLRQAGKRNRTPIASGLAPCRVRPAGPAQFVLVSAPRVLLHQLESPDPGIVLPLIQPTSDVLEPLQRHVRPVAVERSSAALGDPTGAPRPPLRRTRMSSPRACSAEVPRAAREKVFVPASGRFELRHRVRD